MIVDRNNLFEGKLLSFIRIGIAILGVLFLATIVSRLFYPFCNGTWESMNWIPAAHLLEGKNPYAFAFKPPFSMTPYGIVFYALIAAGVELFGFQMWFGRILSVAAFAVCLWAIFKITKKITQSNEAALAACLAGLAMFPAQVWIGIMRSDIIAAAFAMAALSLVFTLEEDRKTSFQRIAGIILLALAAFFTKQTLLLPAAFIFLRFLQLKKWREAVWFFSSFLIPALCGMFLLNQTSSGGYFWQHFTYAQTLPFGLGNSVKIFIEMLKQPAFFFSIVFLGVSGYQSRKLFSKISRRDFLEILRSPKFLILVYFLLSTIWAFLSAGREGGNANYYIENSFAMAIVCGLIYKSFRRNSLRRWTLAMIILLTLGGGFQQVRILRGEYFRWQSLSYYREVFETVGRLAPPNSKCISIYPELAVWNNCAFNFDDFEDYQADWSPELHEIFKREIKAGSYAVIVWHNDKLESEFPNYRLVPMSQSLPERYFPVYLYVPQTSASK